MFQSYPMTRRAGLSALFVFLLAGGMRAAEPDPRPPQAQPDRLRDEVGERVYIYKNDGDPGLFVPAGYMPDGQGISQSTSQTDSPHSMPNCIRIFAGFAEKSWVGIYFLLEESWEPTSSFNLFDKLKAKSGDAIKCRFWARSKDRASVQFKVGGVTKGKISDSLKIPVATPYTELTSKWQMYEIDLTGKDLSSLVGGFLWVADRGHNQKASQITFDLDTIYFVKVTPK
jgi:hypothetical protein